MYKKLFLVFIIQLSTFSYSDAQISLVQFTTGFSTPVDIKNCGDERLFIVEQRGTIQIADINGVNPNKQFLNITNRVRNSGEQGLLGLAFPPDFLTSGYFYVDYVSNTDGHTHISRFHVDSATPDSADPASEEILLSIYQPYTNHKGGHVAFGPDGYLYIGMGDGGSGGDPGNRAQNKDSLLGKILRIDVDPAVPTYRIPPSNPYALDSTLGRGEIWAYGIRNPWRFSFDRLNGDLWIGDVGQNLIEEVDLQRAGTGAGFNYGWRCYEASSNYDLSGGCPAYSQTAPPIFQYNHTGGYCSITGGYRVRGAEFQELYGKYFFVDYCLAQMRYLEEDNAGNFIHTNIGTLGVSSIPTFGEDMNGSLYCSAINSGIIYRFISADCSPVATINAGKDTVNDCGTGSVMLSVVEGNGYDYLWTYNGDTMSVTSSYMAAQTGTYILHVANQACTNSDSVYVDLIAPLNLTFSGLDTLYCIYNSTVNILPNYIGGTFSGLGVNGATFSPTVAGLGSHTVTYMYTNNDGCHYLYSQNVSVDACLNVPGNQWTNTISIFPNPASGDFRLKVFTVNEKKVNLDILDIAGRKIVNEVISLNAGSNDFPIHSELSTGVYIVKLTDEISSTSLKLIIR